jgi:uncharacterized protein (TIGR02996 family)
MDTQQHILRALHDHPADAVSGLALADWLEENGEGERAELTRLRVSLLADPGGDLNAQRRAQALLSGGVSPCVPTVSNAIGFRVALGTVA